MPETVIVRLPNWLGDTVMAEPAVRALRAGLPGARLVLAGPWISALQGQGLADVLVSYPRRWGGRLRVADSLRALEATASVLLPNSFEAALAARYWGGPRRIGFDTAGRGFLLTDRVPAPDPGAHQADEYLALVAPLGAAPSDGVPRLAPPSPDTPEAEAARALLASVAGDGRGPLVGVHLGAAFGPSKLWPVEPTIDCCRRLAREGAVPVLLGAPADRDVGEQVQRAAGVASLVGRDRPELLPALLAGLAALVCGDTGVGHLAAALGTPVVALFGPTDWRRSAPRGTVEVLTHPTPCAPCFYPTCPIDHPCLRGISPARVVERLHALEPGGMRGSSR
jgi:heptosyltransferase-2